MGRGQGTVVTQSVGVDAGGSREREGLDSSPGERRPSRSSKGIFSDEHLVIQELPFTCGPVALLNILHLKNDFSHDESELAKLCKAKLGIGTTHDDLVSAAREVGLELAEEKSHSTLGDIQRHIDNGAYVIICYKNAYSGNSHYTVVVEYDERAIYCRDSAFGFFRLSKEYLGEAWHGDDSVSTCGSKRWFAAFH